MSEPTKNSAMNSDLYHPSSETVDAAHIKDYDALYRRSITDREGF